MRPFDVRISPLLNSLFHIVWLLYCNEFIHFFCSGIVPASEYLFSAPRGLKKKVSFQRGFARYLLAISSTCTASGYTDGSPLQRVPAQIVEVTWVLRVNEGVFKNDVIRQYPTFMSSVVNKVSKWVTGNSLTHFLSVIQMLVGMCI